MCLHPQSTIFLSPWNRPLPDLTTNTQTYHTATANIVSLKMKGPESYYATNNPPTQTQMPPIEAFAHLHSKTRRKNSCTRKMSSREPWGQSQITCRIYRGRHPHQTPTPRSKPPGTPRSPLISPVLIQSPSARPRFLLTTPRSVHPTPAEPPSANKAATAAIISQRLIISAARASGLTSSAFNLDPMLP